MVHAKKHIYDIKLLEETYYFINSFYVAVIAKYIAVESSEWKAKIILISGIGYRKYTKYFESFRSIHKDVRIWATNYDDANFRNSVLSPNIGFYLYK